MHGGGGKKISTTFLIITYYLFTYAFIISHIVQNMTLWDNKWAKYTCLILVQTRFAQKKFSRTNFIKMKLSPETKNYIQSSFIMQFVQSDYV